MQNATHYALEALCLSKIGSNPRQFDISEVKKISWKVSHL